MARLGLLYHLGWLKVKNPYVISRHIDDDEFWESLEIVENGYRFIWSQKYGEIHFRVQKRGVWFYIGNDFSCGKIGSDVKRFHTENLAGISAMYRKCTS